MSAESKSKSFDIFRFPQFLLFRPQAEMTRPVLHEFMKIVAQEFKSEKFSDFKFVAMDLQLKYELDHDFFRVCRGVFTFLKQSNLRFVILNCSDTSKEFLKTSGMSKFVTAISATELASLQKTATPAPEPQTVVEGPDLFIARTWANKVATLISMLASNSQPCKVTGEPARAVHSQFGHNEIMASGNIQLDGEHYFVSITLNAASNLDVFKNCSTYPQGDGAVTPDAWIKEFVNIALHKVLRELADKGHSASCQVPGSQDFATLKDVAAGHISSLTLDFLGTQFICFSAPYHNLADQKAS